MPETKRRVCTAAERATLEVVKETCECSSDPNMQDLNSDIGVSMALFVETRGPCVAPSIYLDWRACTARLRQRFKYLHTHNGNLLRNINARTHTSMASLRRAEALQHHMQLDSVLQSLGSDFEVISVLEPLNAQLASHDDNVAVNKLQIGSLASHIAAGEARMEAGLLSLRSTAGSIQRHHAAGALRLAASSSVHAARRSIIKALFYLLVCLCIRTGRKNRTNTDAQPPRRRCTADCFTGKRKTDSQRGRDTAASKFGGS